MMVDRELKLDQLIDGAEELLTRLADAHDPQIQRLRDRVDEAIRDTRRAITQGDVEDQLRDIVRTVDDYVRDHPWLSLGLGVMVTGALTFAAGITLGARRR